MRSSKPISVTLGRQQATLDVMLERGEYESASEVVRAGLRALDREKAALDEMMRRKIQEALNDPRPDVPADEAFARLHKRIKKARKRAV